MEETTNMKRVLTIAGSDSSGGAGIQADLKTMQANGVFGMSAITALTAQNTTGVTGIMEVTPEFLAAQLDAVFTDIYPDAVKIGMVAAPELINTIADKLQEYSAVNVVVDPVMVATSGARLIKEEAVAALKESLFPLATVITPNLAELECLADKKITTPEEMETTALAIGRQYGCGVLAKGGHFGEDTADDVLADKDEIHWFRGERLSNNNTHGTGCTLSSAIASNLAKGFMLPDAVDQAKAYLTGAIASGLDLGHGRGPLNHGYDLQSMYLL